MGLLVRLSAVTLPLGPASISSVFDILDLELELDFFSFLLDLIVFFKFSLSSFVSDIEPNLVNIKKYNIQWHTLSGQGRGGGGSREKPTLSMHVQSLILNDWTFYFEKSDLCTV